MREIKEWLEKELTKLTERYSLDPNYVEEFSEEYHNEFSKDLERLNNASAELTNYKRVLNNLGINNLDDLKEKLETLQKQIEGLRIAKLLPSEGRNSTTSEKVGQLANKLSEHSEKLEKETQKRDELNGRISEYETMKNKERLSTDLEEFLRAEIDRLNKLLEETNNNIVLWEKEIKEIERKVKEELVDNCQVLQENIKEETEILNQAKDNFMESFKDFGKEKLEKILSYQRIISKNDESNDNNFLLNERDKLFEEEPKELSDKLKEIYGFQDKLIKSEKQLENTEKTANTFHINVQGILAGGDVKVEDFSIKNSTINSEKTQALIEIPIKGE